MWTSTICAMKLKTKLPRLWKERLRRWRRILFIRDTWSVLVPSLIGIDMRTILARVSAHYLDTVHSRVSAEFWYR
jgi:hypothetical protein